MKKCFPVMLLLLFLFRCAALAEAVNPVLGTFEKKLVYMDSAVSISFDAYAEMTDGSRVIVHEDELVMADVEDIAKHREHYRVRPPRYFVETLDKAARQAMFDRWVIEDENYKLSFDTKVRVENAMYGWTELFEFYMVGDQAYEIQIDYGYTENAPWRVMFIYELTRLEES